jgi:hypothetical protein
MRSNGRKVEGSNETRAMLATISTLSFDLLTLRPFDRRTPEASA